MRHSRSTRRSFLSAGAGLALTTSVAPALVGAGAAASPSAGGHAVLDRQLGSLERRTGRTVGVVVGDGRRTLYAYRSGSTFPMCSTFKTLLVAALLRDHAYDHAYWDRTVRYEESDIVENSPVTSVDPDRSSTIDELAEAALCWSDNTAGNLLLREVGGPSGVTRFARSLGAVRTRLDRWEPDLNTAVPGDERDTSTPRDLHHLYTSLLLGNGLDQLGRARLRSWMLRNRTSGARLGQDLPAGVELADKTGAGAYGVVNDVGVYFREDRRVSVAVLTRTQDPDATPDDAVVASIGQLVRERWLR